MILGLALPAPDTAPPPQPVMIMNKPYTIPTPGVGLLDRVMPQGASWGWLWKLRYAFFGKNQSIDIKSIVVDLNGLDPGTVGALPAKPDYTNGQGLQVWRVKEADLQALRQLLKERPDRILASPRVTTGNKTQCGVYCGSPVPINGTQQTVGLRLDLLPAIRKRTVDLTAVFFFTEAITNQAITTDDSGGPVSIRTNFDFAGRFQIPNEMDGIFVLTPPSGITNEKRMSILTDVKSPSADKIRGAFGVWLKLHSAEEARPRG